MRENGYERREEGNGEERGGERRCSAGVAMSTIEYSAITC